MENGSQAIPFLLEVSEMAKAKQPETATADNQPTSKMGMVRAALEHLGKGATPTEIVGYLRNNHNTDISAATAGVYKSKILNPKKGTKRQPRQERQAVSVQAQEVKQPVEMIKDGETVSVNLSDLEQVAGLVERLGLDGVKQLVKVVAFIRQ